MERRIQRLEASRVETQTRLWAEQIADEDGLDPDELIAGARRLRDAVGPTATLEEMVAYVAELDGLTPDEEADLIAHTRARMEGNTP